MNGLILKTINKICLIKLLTLTKMMLYLSIQLEEIYDRINIRIFLLCERPFLEFC